jgi:hypothetical protein
VLALIDRFYDRPVARTAVDRNAALAEAA